MYIARCAFFGRTGVPWLFWESCTVFLQCMGGKRSSLDVCQPSWIETSVRLRYTVAVPPPPPRLNKCKDELVTRKNYLHRFLRSRAALIKYDTGSRDPRHRSSSDAISGDPGAPLRRHLGGGSGGSAGMITLLLKAWKLHTTLLVKPKPQSLPNR